MVRKSNSNLTKAHPDTADQVFDEHWKTWFTKHDVHRFTELGLNTVRIPVRLVSLEVSWISVLTANIKAWLLARRTPRRRGRVLPQGWNASSCMSPYPFPDTSGYLHRPQRNGLKWLKNAGIAVILDHHALPGVAASNQMFAGL